MKKVTSLLLLILNKVWFWMCGSEETYRGRFLQRASYREVFHTRVSCVVRDAQLVLQNHNLNQTLKAVLSYKNEVIYVTCILAVFSLLISTIISGVLFSLSFRKG
jgi:hypothetical protein